MTLTQKEVGKDVERGSYFVLNEKEVSFFDSFCSFVVPSGRDPQREPGAKEVGAVRYIDSTLFSLSKEGQDYFFETIKLIEELSKSLFNEKAFCELSTGDKNIVFRALYLDPNTKERAFDIRSLALEGFYSDYHDPWYKGKSGWEVIGFSGKRISDIKKDWTFLKVWKDYRPPD